MSNNTFVYSPMEYVSRPDFGKADYDKEYNRAYLECKCVASAHGTANKLKNPADSFSRHLKEFEGQLDILLQGYSWSSLRVPK